MKAFNLKEYLQLKKKNKEPRIVTRDGRDVRILCTDMKAMGGEVIGALVMEREGNELFRSYYSDGSYGKGAKEELDLFFADLDEEPRYRPFENGDEFKEVQKEKGLYLYFKGARVYKMPTGINHDTVAILWDSGKVEEESFSDLFENAVWPDGSPCGVKED